MWRELAALLGISVGVVVVVVVGFGVLTGYLGVMSVVVFPFLVVVTGVTVLWYVLARHGTPVPAGPLSARWRGVARAYPILFYLESLLWGATTAALTGVTYELMLRQPSGFGLPADWSVQGIVWVPLFAVFLMWPFIVVVSPLALLAWRWALVSVRTKRKAGA